MEADTSKKTLVVAPDPAFGTGHLVAEASFRKKIEMGLSAWKELSCKHEFEIIKERSRYVVRKCRLCQKVEKEWK